MTRAPDAIRAFLRACIARGDFPGAAWAVFQAPDRLLTGALGNRIVTGPRLPVRRHTLFDLASLTKPLCAALVALRLVRRSILDLRQPISEHLPALRRRRIGSLSMLDLLSHRSGLPAWKPLYLTCRTLPEAVDAIASTRLSAPPRTRVIYSDLNYILAGAVLREAGGAPIDRLFSREVTRPLGVRALFFNPSPSLRRLTAATERGNQFERTMVGRAGAAYGGFRRNLIWGQVHDHNAYTLDGACGHAGLFGDANSVLIVARAVLGDPPGYLSEDLRRLLFGNQTRGMGGHRTFGLELASNPGSCAGRSLSPGAIGHTGFTGTSLFIDSRRQAVFILLTNRMHPVRSGCDMNEVRGAFHDVAARALRS